MSVMSPLGDECSKLPKKQKEKIYEILENVADVLSGKP